MNMPRRLPAGTGGLLPPGLMFSSAVARPAPDGSLLQAGADSSGDEIAAQTSDAFKACLQTPAARAVRPREHCVALEIDAQNERLERTVRSIALASGPDEAKAFEREQEEWRAALDARCTPPADRRGSLAGQVAQRCFLDGIIRRRLVLERRR